jgi:hypothetical protein
LAQQQKVYTDEIDSMRVKLSRALKSQNEVEEKIALVTSELQESKSSYEGQIAALSNDLERANQINNELKVRCKSYE